MAAQSQTNLGSNIFSFFKGGEDILAPREGAAFDWEEASRKVREHLNDAMNARHVSFLLGSGCSSYQKNGKQLGVSTMAPLAAQFLSQKVGEAVDKSTVLTEAERGFLKSKLGLDLQSQGLSSNLERLMEILFAARFTLEKGSLPDAKKDLVIIRTVITKVTKFLVEACISGSVTQTDTTVLRLYESFYRKLTFRDRALPRPWVFTTNYDLFNERALDKAGIPFANGFMGFIDRRFNPSTFRYALAEQLDVSARKWSAVDEYLYLVKLHGSINWVESDTGLFPISEFQDPRRASENLAMIYPTPAKQNASLGSPYSDLFREFQSRITRDQSVLVVLGFGFGDEHINNIIYQALTVPTFRLIAFLPPNSEGPAGPLLSLKDPRVWVVGGAGPDPQRQAHYFDTFVEKFMPEPPGTKVDSAIERVIEELTKRRPTKNSGVPEDGL